MDPLVHTILSAAEQGHKQRLATLLRENQGMAEACDEEGSTPLMYAAANGRENVMHLLVQNQVNVNAQNLYGWTALMQASCYGHLTCVMLLVQYKAEITMVNSWGASALVGAAQGGFDTVVQFLLDKGASVNVAEEVTSLTSLMAAAQCGHVEIATKLIKAGSNVNAVLTATGWSALMLAAINNQEEVVSLLLQHGARKDLQDLSKRTAVQLATALGQREAAQVLDGERIDTVSDADFFEAVKTGQAERVEAMLQESPALAKAKTKDGVTPLMRAANKGYVKVCETLLKAGCPVNAKDSVNGWTALMQATHQRRYEVAKLLGCHGAAVNLRGKSGSTAFDIANMLGDIEMIRIVANISVERIRKTSAPSATTTTAETLATPTATVATPTAATPTTTIPPKSPGVVEKRVSVPLAPQQLRNAQGPAKPLDTSELIRRLKLAYANPVSPPSIPTTKAAVSTVQNSTSVHPRFPSSRLRNQKLTPVSIPSSPISSSADSVSPGTSTNTSCSAQLDGSSQSRDYPLTPEPPKSASYLTSHQTGARDGKGGPTKFLSRSNPPSTECPSNKRTGRGEINIPPLRISPNRHSLLSLERTGTKGSGRPLLTRDERIGERNKLPSFLHKYGPPSHIPPTIVIPGRPKEIVPKSWALSGQKSLETEKLQLRNVPLRRRSLTVPTNSTKPALQTALEQSCLGEYYNIFAEQELDLSSFVTLSESDLIDLCITNDNDRQRLLALIQRLQNRNRTAASIEQNGASPNGATPKAPVFLFQ